MQTMILETFLALGLCLAAVMIFAVSDLYHEAHQRRLQQRGQRRALGAGVRFGGVIQQLAMRKHCWGHGLSGH